ncbi:hypothetical protein D3C79_682980 [compost metagenome]
MVGRVAAEDEVERGIGERQAFGGTALGGDIGQAALGGGTGDHVEHGLREVVGDHFGDQRGDVEADMAGAAAQVQHAGTALPRQRGLQQGKFTALGVHGAAEVGAGLFAELALDHIGVLGAGHVSILLVLGCLYWPYRRQASSHREPTVFRPVEFLWELACRR